MNDFTKEELEDLYICCGSGIHDDYPLEDWKKELREKIKYMIDNYCEHKDRVSSSDDNGHMVVQCGKCDFVIWHEKD